MEENVATGDNIVEGQIIEMGDVDTGPCRNDSSPTGPGPAEHIIPSGDSAGRSNDYDGGEEEIKTYWWRWVVLGVFGAILANSNGIWIAFAPIADVTRCYYGVSNFWVNSLVMVNMLVYILFVLPSIWLLNAVGLRTTVVIAACCNAVGAGLRMAAVGSQYFWLLLTGQTVASVTALLLFGCPSYLSSIWFPPSQRGVATAIGGGLSQEVGFLLGFLSPIIVHSEDTNTVCSGNATSDQQHQWTETIYSQLLYYLSAQTAVSLLLVILSLVAFPSAPPTPPSKSRQLFETTSSVVHTPSHLKTLLSVVKNGYFMLFLITAGINVGAAAAMSSLLNEFIHVYFPNDDYAVAYVGLAATLSGVLTIIVIAVVLDITKAFYVINVGIYFCGLLSIGGFLACMEFQNHVYILYPLATLIGFSVTAFQGIAYEYGAEMTYPLPEGTSGGLFNWVSQPFAIMMVVVGPNFIKLNGKQVPIGGWTIVTLLLIGAVLTLFIRPKLRKTTIDREKNNSSTAVIINDI